VLGMQNDPKIQVPFYQPLFNQNHCTQNLH